MEEMKKPVYVDVNEVCADWGVCRSKGYAIFQSIWCGNTQEGHDSR